MAAAEALGAEALVAEAAEHAAAEALAADEHWAYEMDAMFARWAAEEQRAAAQSMRRRDDRRARANVAQQHVQERAIWTARRVIDGSEPSSHAGSDDGEE